MAVAEPSFGRNFSDAFSSAAREPLPMLAALYILCVLFPVFFSAGSLLLGNLRVLLLVVTVPLLAMSMFGRYGKILLTDYLFVAYIGWTFVALMVNNPDRAVQNVGSSGLEFLGGYAVGRATIRTPGHFLALCRWLIGIVLLLLPFSLFETVTGKPVILETLRSIPGIKTAPILNNGTRLGLERVQAVFSHPIHFGLFCSIAFSMSFVALRNHTSETWRLLTGGIALFSGFLALSSGALMAMVMQLMLITWAFLFANNPKRWWLLIGLFALAYVTVDLLSNRTPIRVFLSYATFSAHTAYWRTIIFEWGMINVWANPLYGVGLNDWVRPSFMVSGSIDNFWLVNAVRYGIPAFVFLASGYLLVLFGVMRRNFDGDETLIMIRRAWVFTFLGLTFTLCTVHVWHNLYSFVFFMFGAGSWMLTAEPQDRSDGEPVPLESPGRGGHLFRRDHSLAAAQTPSQPPVHARARDAASPVREGPAYSRFPAGSRPPEHSSRPKS